MIRKALEAQRTGRSAVACTPPLLSARKGTGTVQKGDAFGKRAPCLDVAAFI